MHVKCKGCRIYREDTDRFKCGFVSLNAQSYCPCINCLVKVVCQERCGKRLNQYPGRIAKFVKEVGSDRYM